MPKQGERMAVAGPLCRHLSRATLKATLAFSSVCRYSTLTEPWL